MNIQEKLAAESKAAKQILDMARAENRDMTEEEAKSFDEHVTAAEQYKGMLEKMTANQKKLDSLVIDGEADLDADDHPNIGEKSVGDRYVHSKNYSAYSELVKKGLASGDIRLGKSRLGSLDEFYAQKAGTALTTDLAYLQPQRMPVVDLVDRPPITLLDIITRGNIASRSLEYVQITSVTRNRAIVPENTGADSADTQKPQSTFATSKATAQVYDYADGYTVTNQMLEDAQVFATYLNSEFTYSFDSKIADVLLNGSGTDNEPKGLLNTTGVQAGEWSKSGDEAMNITVAVRKALTKLTHVGAQANAILINPADAEKIDLMKDSQGRFYGQGPFSTGPTMLWGRPFVQSEQIDEGKLIVGDFKQLALLDHKGLSIDVFNQHKDYASRNLVYVRAELSAAQVVWRPSNFVVLEGKAQAADKGR